MRLLIVECRFDSYRRSSHYKCGNHGWVFLHICTLFNKMKFLKSLPAVFQSKINWLCPYPLMVGEAICNRSIPVRIGVGALGRIKLSIKLQLVSRCVCTSRGNAWNMLLINEKMV